MIFQDANQVYKYWCFGEVLPPIYTTTVSGDYWLSWVPASTTAG